jgi:acyl-coenzyme A synthetase/AMP-(fatty) acid ligase
MKFISLDGTGKNIITDGIINLYYEDIPKTFDNIRNILKKKNISQKDILTLECINSVPTAILILYFLHYGYSFLLIPEQKEKQLLPVFCKYRISVRDIDSDENLDFDHFFNISENKRWRETGRQFSETLYLKTSGSTGKAKMAVYSHKKLIGNALNCVNRLNIQSSNRIAIPVPIYHMFGLGAAFLPAIIAGASIDLQKGANLLRYLDRERKFKPDMVFMTPVFCETLVKGRKAERFYKLTVSAGDRLREKTFDKYESMFGSIVQLYGSTEMGAIASASSDDSSEIRRVTAGKPMDGVKLHIEDGELLCFHKHSFESYMDEQGEMIYNKQNGWFPTKDLGRIMQDGSIEVLGRSDQSINRHGLLVFLSDIEKTIESIEGIDCAVATASKENMRGKDIILHCLVDTANGINEQYIKNACFDMLPKNAIPDHVKIVTSFPLLANGKIDRQKLNRMFYKNTGGEIA